MKNQNIKTAIIVIALMIVAIATQAQVYHYNQMTVRKLDAQSYPRLKEQTVKYTTGEVTINNNVILIDNKTQYTIIQSNPVRLQEGNYNIPVVLYQNTGKFKRVYDGYFHCDKDGEVITGLNVMQSKLNSIYYNFEQ